MRRWPSTLGVAVLSLAVLWSGLGEAAAASVRAESEGTLHVSIRPRVVTVGERRGFAIRVWIRSRGHRRAVRGAIVRLARVERRTDRRGAAVVRLGFTAPGVVAVVARKRGLRSGRSRIRVVPRRRPQPPPTVGGPPGQIAPVAAPTADAPSGYRNPVYGSSFPDPAVLRVAANEYYAYGTGSGFPVLRSTDLVNWSAVGTALSARPGWVVGSGDSHPWAPSVLRSERPCPGTTSPGCYLLYYVGLHGTASPPTHCVAVATSPSAAGPFHDLGPIQGQDGVLDLSGRPPGCGDDAGYSNIDPAPFVDQDGSAYLYLSTGRRCEQPTIEACPSSPTISVIPLASDLVHAGAPRKPLLAATPGTWEQEPGDRPTVENPWMERRGSTYYLFYSGGDHRHAYGMGYATASSPTGGAPYAAFAKAPTNPILRQTADVLSPGGGSLTKGPRGGDWLVYHGRAGDYGQPRTLRIDPVVWGADGSVAVRGPTTLPQSPAP